MAVRFEINSHGNGRKIDGGGIMSGHDMAKFHDGHYSFCEVEELTEVITCNNVKMPKQHINAWVKQNEWRYAAKNINMSNIIFRLISNKNANYISAS